MHVPRPNVDVHHQTSHPQRRLAEFVSSRSFRVSTATHHPGQREHHSPAAWDFTNSQNSQNSHFANRIASGPGLHEAVGWGCFGSILIKRRKILSGTSCTSHNSARSEGNKRNKETKGPRQAVMFADYLQTRTIYDYVLIRYWLFFICALEMPTTDPKIEHLDALCRDRAALRPEPLQCGTAKSSKNQWPKWFKWFFVMFLISLRVQMSSLGWHFVQTMAAAWLPLWQSFQAVLQLVVQPSVMTCNVFSLQIPKNALARFSKIARRRTETICRSSFNDNSETLLPPESAFHDIMIFHAIQGHQMPSLRFKSRFEGPMQTSPEVTSKSPSSNRRAVVLAVRGIFFGRHEHAITRTHQNNFKQTNTAQLQTFRSQRHPLRHKS